jgi:hypothetical protein
VGAVLESSQDLRPNLFGNLPKSIAIAVQITCGTRNAVCAGQRIAFGPIRIQLRFATVEYGNGEDSDTFAIEGRKGI